MTKIFSHKSSSTTSDTSSVPESSAPQEEQRKKVARCLFGRPKPGETDQYLRKKLSEIQQEDQKKWGFDFDRDHPVLTPASTSSEWNWVPLHSSSVPSFYRAIQAPPSIPPSSIHRPEVDYAKDSRKSDEETPKKRKIGPESQSAVLPGSPKKRTRVDQFFASRKRPMTSETTAQKSSQPVEQANMMNSGSHPVSAKVSKCSSAETRE